MSSDREWFDAIREPGTPADDLAVLIQRRRLHSDAIQDLDDRMRKLVDEHPELKDIWAEAIGLP